MSPKRLNELWPVLEHFRDGGKIEVRLKGDRTDNWDQIDDPSFTDHCEYRIKPEPKLRPWKPEEVPLGAQMRNKVEGLYRALIMCVDGSGRVFTWSNNSGNNNPVLCAESLDMSLRYREHSTDGGKTWHPCGVLDTEVAK